LSLLRMIPNLMQPIRRKVDSVAENLPLPARRDFTRYLHRARRNNQRTTLRAGSRIPPYWLLLPWWVSKAQIRHATPQVLDDILWGQYCLYLGIRIRDDLFDRHTWSRHLGSASTKFLQEAKKAYLRHFPPASVFWTYHRRCLHSTQVAILCVDRIQRNRSSRPSHLLREYAKVSSIFKVGAFALCVLLQRKEWMRQISQFADGLATAGQILDDLEDISDDLAAGRLNYAALFTLKSFQRKNLSLTRLSARIANQIFFSDTVDGIFAVTRHHLDLAASALKSLPVPGPVSYLNHYYTQLDKYQKDLRSGRSRFISFSQIMLPKPG